MDSNFNKPAQDDFKRPISEDNYKNLFLDDEDFENQLAPGQKHLFGGSDPEEKMFAELEGIYSGLSVWNAQTDDGINRAVDIRWVFPTDWQARRFLFANLDYLSEGAEKLDNAPLVGEDCQAFLSDGDQYGLDLAVDLQMYYYIFRVGRVNVKLFASVITPKEDQGWSLKSLFSRKKNVKNEDPYLEKITAYANKVVKRIEKYG